jgi:hypothetical protein
MNEFPLSIADLEGLANVIPVVVSTTATVPISDLAITLAQQPRLTSAISPGASATEALLDRLTSEATSELERYSRYPRGWDGYDGEPFSKGLLTIANNLTNYIAAYFSAAEAQPDLLVPGPASDGSLDLEVRHQGKRLILTLYPENPSIIVYQEDDEGRARDEQPLSEAAVASRLSWLVR